MINFVDEIASKITELHDYWPGFEPVAYALYNRDHVYLFNHPDNANMQILKRDEQFNGCTLILYNDFPTAIVDLQQYRHFANAYSILVHELFHGYQYIKGEHRFADESLAITYPLTKANIELRNMERATLYNALFETALPKMQHYVQTFIALREKRATLIDNFLSYENLIETIEGPAWYVELKAYSDQSTLDYDSVLKKYGESLIDKFSSAAEIRKSCYSSGMAVCLLLDRLKPNWKETFFNIDVTLYELLKSISNDRIEISHVEISSETEEVFHFVHNKRKQVMEDFEQQIGIHLLIEGNITATSFDPMNIVAFGEKLLHQNFIHISINNAKYFIQQPVIAFRNDGIQGINKLHLVLKNAPFENDDTLVIEGIGTIKGRYLKQENVFYLYTN